MEGRAERADRLYELAESQEGYFTSADAKSLGYDYPYQYYHVQQGNWIRVDRGIFRLKKFPASKYEDLIRWWLWSRKKGVVSHETAAAVYELGELLPSKVHLTVPRGFRKIPARGVVLHRDKLQQSEIEWSNGFRITTPLRTIMDLAKSLLDPERLSAVVKDAIQKGLVTKKQLLDVLSEIPEGVDPATQVTLQLAVRE